MKFGQPQLYNKNLSKHPNIVRDIEEYKQLIKVEFIDKLKDKNIDLKDYLMGSRLDSNFNPNNSARKQPNNIVSKLISFDNKVRQQNLINMKKKNANNSIKQILTEQYKEKAPIEKEKPKPLNVKNGKDALYLQETNIKIINKIDRFGGSVKKMTLKIVIKFLNDSKKSNFFL